MESAGQKEEDQARDQDPGEPARGDQYHSAGGHGERPGGRTSIKGNIAEGSHSSSEVLFFLLRSFNQVEPIYKTAITDKKITSEMSGKTTTF